MTFEQATSIIAEEGEYGNPTLEGEEYNRDSRRERIKEAASSLGDYVYESLMENDLFGDERLFKQAHIKHIARAMAVAMMAQYRHDNIEIPSRCTTPMREELCNWLIQRRIGGVWETVSRHLNEADAMSIFHILLMDAQQDHNVIVVAPDGKIHAQGLPYDGKTNEEQRWVLQRLFDNVWRPIGWPDDEDDALDMLNRARQEYPKDADHNLRVLKPDGKVYAFTNYGSGPCVLCGSGVVGKTSIAA